MNAPTYTKLPVKALRLAAELMRMNSQKGDTWESLTIDEHLDHAMNHIILYLEGDKTEKHLVNATCRILMASEVEISGQDVGEKFGPGMPILDDKDVEPVYYGDNPDIPASMSFLR